MATFHVLPVGVTVAGTPRISSTANYSGARSQSVMLQLVSSTWATDDPSITVSLGTQVSFDNGNTWQDFCAMTTHPQMFNVKTGAVPALNCYAGDDRGPRLVRAVLSVDRSQLTLGVDATV